MDELIQKAIKHNEQMKEPLASVPWKADEPHAQSYYVFDQATQAWKPLTPSSNNDATQDGAQQPMTRLALYSWNIDFMLPYAKSRMDAALAHLNSLVGALPSTTAAVIFLQESISSDLTTIGEKSWVRERFNVTDADNANWASRFYGTTTLVDRRLPITSCFRVHYLKTRMERDGLFVDVSVEGKTIRFCNTHLESLAFEPPFRPPQMQIVAKHMHADGVHGALVAGDFNAIQPFDRKLHSDNHLKDAYLELGGHEDSDAGYTWGQQAATTERKQFGCSRMDKVYFRGGLKLQRFERFGADVQLSHQEEKDSLVALGFDKPWITDHLGVMAEFDVDQGSAS